MKKETSNLNKLISIAVLIIALLFSLYKYGKTALNLIDLDGLFKTKISDKEISELIEDVEVKEDQNVSYNREDWTSSTQSYFYKGQHFTSIRAYAFYASIYYDDKNNVYLDPYSGEKHKNIDNIDYDHIIPLSYVNRHNGHSWGNEKKRNFADDPNVGVNVNSHDNRIKSDKGPASWLPKENKDDYCYTWLVIADKYNISISPTDMKVIKKELKNKSIEDVKIINEYK